MQPYQRYAIILTGLSMMAIAWFWPHQKPVDPSPISTSPVIVDQKDYILVASRSLDPGKILTADQAEWVLVAQKPIPSGATTHKGGDDSANPFVGRLIVQAAAKGDALLPQYFASADSVSYLAQQISSGKRAYAIAIDSKGTATAGNFILPNDRVDVIRSFNSYMGLHSETILTNIRVLAVGQSVHGDGLLSSGDTVTVEVDLHEAEVLATAQRTGQISLALRSPVDAQENTLSATSINIIRPNMTADKSP